MPASAGSKKRSISRALDTLLRRDTAGHEVAKTLPWREYELVHWVVYDLHNWEIVEKLAISEGIVKMHLHHIYTKLQVPGRFSLFQYAINKG